MENDTFPHIMCTMCVERLTSTYLFREMCLESEEKFKLFHPTSIKVVNSSEYLHKSNTNENIDDDGQFDEPNNEPISEDFIENGQINIETSNPKIKSKNVQNHCDICNKAFISKHAMQKHKKIHQNCPELSCKICDKQFTR